jgi:hypothetical protein
VFFDTRANASHRNIFVFEDAAEVRQVQKHSAFFERKRDMERESLLSLLAAQIECAKSQVRRARESGRDASAIERIVGSLRLTLAAVLSGLDPLRTVPSGFILEAGRGREPLMKLGDQSVPVGSAYIGALLGEAGVELAPGQVILLDAELVRDLVEEALGRIAFDQAMAEKERAELQAALTRTPDCRLESVETAIGEILDKTDGIRRQKAALLFAGLALDELGEEKVRPKRAA